MNNDELKRKVTELLVNVLAKEPKPIYQGSMDGELIVEAENLEYATLKVSEVFLSRYPDVGEVNFYELNPVTDSKKRIAIYSAHGFLEALKEELAFNAII